jgi:hypothetical protein
MKKIYLAIPYTGMQESSYKQATVAACYIAQTYRYNVFSPITHSHPLAEMGLHGSWEDYWKKVDFQYIEWADEVWVLVPDEGEERVRVSTGVQDEISYCKSIEKPLRYVKLLCKHERLSEAKNYTEVEELKFVEAPQVIKFTADDIVDKEKLEKMIQREAEEIFNSENSRKGRDLETIKMSVRQGKVAELYLIENFGYHEAHRKWHDLLNRDGEYVEVKAYNTTSSKAPFVEKDLRKIRNEGWNHSSWYILFKFKDGQYEFLEKIRVR